MSVKSWMSIMMLLSLTVVSYGESTDGREFIVMFLQTRVIEKDPTLIVATTENSSIVRVRIPKIYNTQTYYVAAWTKLEIAVPKSVVPTSDGLDNLGILIESTAVISLWGMHDASNMSVDGFLALPTNLLGREYFGASSEPHSGAELGVVGTKDGTRVTITYDHPYMFDGRELIARYPLKVKLDRFETLFINSYADITGIHIESSAPVAAFSGNQCAFIPLSLSYCDYTVTQLVPFERWGMKYFVTPFFGHINYVVKVIAGRGRTTVSVGEGKQQYALTEREFLTLSLNSSEVITSTRPVLVVQFTLDQTLDDGISHLAMTLVPAIRQYTDDAVIATFSGDQLSLHYLNLVATCYNLKKQYILLDGTPIEFNNTEIYIDDIEYCISRLSLNTSYSRITALKPDASFSAIINERTEFFSTARAAKLQLTQTTCSTSNEDGVSVAHDCDDEVVIFTYPCPEPCPVGDEELICEPCMDGFAIFLVMFMSSGLTICVEQFVRCCRAGCQDEREVDAWKRKAAMNQKALDTSAWDRQMEAIRKNERKKLEKEFNEGEP